MLPFLEHEQPDEMHSKNIRANLATASLVVIAACLAGPHVVRIEQFIWEYPDRQSNRRLQEECVANRARVVPKGAPLYDRPGFDYPVWVLFDDQYEACLKGFEIPDEQLIKQPEYFFEEPSLPDRENFFESFLWFLRDPVGEIERWFFLAS